MEADDILVLRPEFKALSSFARTDDTPLQDAITAFIKPASGASLVGSQAVDDYVWDSCNIIIAVAAETPHRQQAKLIQFVRELQQQTLKAVATGEELKHEDGVLWRDLPALGWAARDAWNFSPRDFHVTREQKERWVSQNALFARLTAEAATLDPNTLLDYSLFGLWTLREAFEVADQEQTPGHGALRAACMWMLYATDALWSDTLAGRQFEDDLAIGEGEYRERGWTGFTKERWGVWKKGLLAASEIDDDEQLRQLVNDTIRQVERVQNHRYSVVSSSLP